MPIIRGNAKHEPPVIRACVFPAVAPLLHDPSGYRTSRPLGVDCRALLDTGADGVSVSRALAEAAQLSYLGKTLATGISGENYHRSWTAFLGVNAEEEIGPLPFVLQEPFLAIEVRSYPVFDMIIGREVLLLGRFCLESNGDFEFNLPG